MCQHVCFCLQSAFKCAWVCVVCAFAHVEGVAASVPLLWSVFFWSCGTSCATEKLFCISPPLTCQLENLTCVVLFYWLQISSYLWLIALALHRSLILHVPVMEMTRRVIENFVIFWCRTPETNQTIKITFTSLPASAVATSADSAVRSTVTEALCSTLTFYHWNGITSLFCFLW